MKKKIFAIIIMFCLIACCLCGCDTEASRVEYNLTQEAENFNVVRQLTVINCIGGGCFIPDDWKDVYYRGC